jgi:hypothetical protein
MPVRAPPRNESALDMVGEVVCFFFVGEGGRRVRV